MVIIDQITKTPCYYIKNDILMRRWTPNFCDGLNLDITHQVVVHTIYQKQVLSLAHENQWAGRFGINKTDKLILKSFFWPGLKSDAVNYCHTCHICQLAGKPNQVIQPAPLRPKPIQDIGTKRTKAGNQYLLTMCAHFSLKQYLCIKSQLAQLSGL